jgi:hypothetical protein
MKKHKFTIGPPPKDQGPVPLYRVVYVIDVNAGDAQEAARYAHQIMTDPASMRPVLDVLDSEGRNTRIDLSEDAKQADYCAVAEYLAEQGREIFTGRMTGGLWNGRCLDACIMSKKQGDKAAYEFLLEFGDQLASSLSADQQRQWQGIKDHAAGLLKGRTENTHEI